MKAQQNIVTLIAGFALSILISTSVFAGPVGPNQTEYLKTTGAGFSIDRSAGALYYAMTYQIRKSLKAPLYVLVQYQNPSDNSTPFIQSSIFKPKQRLFRTESPVFRRIKNNNSYEVLIKLYDDEGRKNLISKHSQQVYFSLPKKLAPKLGIEFIR